MRPPSQPPEAEESRPSVTIDQFYQSLSASEKEILTRYLAIDPSDTAGQTDLIRLYGKPFTELAYRVQRLVQDYGCGSGAIRQALLLRLEKEHLNLTFRPGADSSQDSVRRPIDPYALTEHSSEPPPDPRVQKTVALLQSYTRSELRDLYEDDQVDHANTDKTCIPVIRPIVLRTFTALEAAGLELSAKEMRALIHQALVVIRSQRD